MAHREIERRPDQTDVGRLGRPLGSEARDRIIDFTDPEGLREWLKLPAGRAQERMDSGDAQILMVSVYVADYVPAPEED